MTKGIWVWCVRHPHKTDTCLVLLDTEGLGDVEKVLMLNFHSPLILYHSCCIRIIHIIHWEKNSRILTIYIVNRFFVLKNKMISRKNKNLAIANRSRVSCINTNNNTMTLKSGLEVTQGH